MTIQMLLDEVKKTNSAMTEKKLIEELGKSDTSARVLIAMCEDWRRFDRFQDVV